MKAVWDDWTGNTVLFANNYLSPYMKYGSRTTPTNPARGTRAQTYIYAPNFTEVHFGRKWSRTWEQNVYTSILFMVDTSKWVVPFRPTGLTFQENIVDGLDWACDHGRTRWASRLCGVATGVRNILGASLFQNAPLTSLNEALNITSPQHLALRHQYGPAAPLPSPTASNAWPVLAIVTGRSTDGTGVPSYSFNTVGDDARDRRGEPDSLKNAYNGFYTTAGLQNDKEAATEMEPEVAQYFAAKAAAPALAMAMASPSNAKANDDSAKGPGISLLPGPGFKMPRPVIRVINVDLDDADTGEVTNASCIAT